MRAIIVASMGIIGLGLSAGQTLAGDDLVERPQLLTAADGVGAAPPPTGDSADLAKKLSNPVADLISIPFQFNYDEGYGPEEAGRWSLNVQPVIPISLGNDWNLITRTIVPLVYQESPFEPGDDEFGLGDIVQSFFFSPKAPIGGWIVGVGPVFNWPTATEDALGSEKWGAGPTAVLLKQDSGWTYGVLANHIWSFAGDDDRDDINVTFLQPFLSYTFPSATTVTLNTESSYNWDSDDWTVPINLQVSQLVRLGKLPVQFAIGGRWYAESPDGGPEWGARFVMTILLPK
jgi:hypothetical protein